MATRIRITGINPSLDQLAKHLQSLHAAGWTVPQVPRAWAPPVNAFEGPTEFWLCVELPGMKKEDIDLLVEPRRVIVRGERACAEKTDKESVKMLALEIAHGRFERRIDLSRDVDRDRVKARYENGLLWVELPFQQDV